MKKYIVIYHAPMSAMEQMQNTPPEEAKKGMEMWMQWAAKCGDHLVDHRQTFRPGPKRSFGANQWIWIAHQSSIGRRRQ